MQQLDAHVSSFILGCEVYARFLRWELGTFGIDAPNSVKEERLSALLDKAYEETYGIAVFRFAKIYTKRIRCTVCGKLNHNARHHRRKVK